METGAGSVSMETWMDFFSPLNYYHLLQIVNLVKEQKKMNE